MLDDDTQHIAKMLSKTEYASLFLITNPSIMDSIWQNGKNQEKLENIIANNQYENYVRFLASEILFEKVKNYPSDTSLYQELAKVYTDALKYTARENNKFKLSGNVWGFLYEMDDIGSVGNHLVAIGNRAIPYLAELLNNSNTVLYDGSKEATLGNSYKYRINDFAAFFIGKIKNIPLKYYPKNADRDAQIKQLEIKLKASKDE